MKTIKLSEIIIPESFKRSKPNEWKLNKVRDYVGDHYKLDKPIVLNDNNIITDNYVRYLVALEYGIEEVPYVSDKEYNRHITYIVGKFDNCNKRYKWKISKDICIEVGDKVLVECENLDGSNEAIVTVARIFTSNNHHMLKHKSVIRRIE